MICKSHYQLVIFSYIFLNFFLWFTTSTNTIYLEYIIQLNSWKFNIFFLLISVLSISNISLSLFNFFIVFFNSMYAGINYNATLSLLNSLWVGTILLHPFLFYFSFLCIFFFNMGGFLYRNKFLKMYTTLVIGCALLSLFLGCLWGSQSLSWGYFWVNDKIEWVLLFICFYFVLLKHIYYNPNKCYFFMFIFFFFSLILVYIRLNLVSTRHSFFLNKLVYYKYLFLFLFLYGLIFFYKSYSSSLLTLFFSLVFYFYLIFFIKMTLFIYVYYFLIDYKFFFFKKSNNLLHLIISIFFIIWVSVIYLFLINYSFKHFLNLNFTIFYKQIILANNFFYEQSIFFLDKIFFYNFNIILNHTFIINLLRCYFIFLENILIFVALIVFFLTILLKT